MLVMDRVRISARAEFFFHKLRFLDVSWRNEIFVLFTVYIQYIVCVIGQIYLVFNFHFSDYCPLDKFKTSAKLLLF